MNVNAQGIKSSIYIYAFDHLTLALQMLEKVQTSSANTERMEYNRGKHEGGILLWLQRGHKLTFGLESNPSLAKPGMWARNCNPSALFIILLLPLLCGGSGSTDVIWLGLSCPKGGVSSLAAASALGQLAVTADHKMRKVQRKSKLICTKLEPILQQFQIESFNQPNYADETEVHLRKAF